MRIVIDLQACQATNRNRGIGRYSLDLAKAMIESCSSHDFWILANGRLIEGHNAIKGAFCNLLPPENIITFDVPTPAAENIARNRWRTQAAEQVREFAIAQIQPDILHLTSLFEGFVDDAVTSVAAPLTSLYPTAVTLYDLIPLTKPEIYLQDIRSRQWYERKLISLKDSSALLAISEHSRKEAISRLNFSLECTFNISAAVSTSFREVEVSEDEAARTRTRYGINRPFVMYTGGIDPRKNIEQLIESYSSLSDEVRTTHQLLIVCSIQPYDLERLSHLSKKKGLTARDIQFTGYISDEDLLTLYNLCKLFVFPSLDEGFGLPALEAMACGAAVIASDVSSIPEVIGRRPDALFNPSSRESITKAMHSVLTNSDLLSSLRDHSASQARQFSWKKSAKRAMEALEITHERHLSQKTSVTQVAHPHKRRLAFVSPLPPLRSGISDYSAELVPYLSDYYDVTLITEQTQITAGDFGSNTSIKDVTWFCKNAQDFDRIIYQFGNSAFHWYMFDLLKQHPGVVVLHDFYLSSVAYWMVAGGLTKDSFAKKLYASHGYPSLIHLQEKGTDSAVWAYSCNRALIDQAAGIIVHSNHAKELAKKYFNTEASKGWSVIPQIYKPPISINRSEARSALNFSESDFVVCSFGMLGPTKLSHRLLDAWLNSDISTDRQCHLIFVGENNSDNEYGKNLIRRIRSLGNRLRIKITGFLEPQRYEYYLAAADTAVQLRTRSRGETSRAILETLSYGIPLIANRHGSIKDYPDDIFIQVEDAFSDDELIDVIMKCRNEAAFRAELGCRGRTYVTEQHSPEKTARLYYKAIENSWSVGSPSAQYKALIDSLARIDAEPKPNEADLVITAESIVNNRRVSTVRQLLVDISELVRKDVKTGIQRVVRSILSTLLHDEQIDYRIEPVYFDGIDYRYARKFTTTLLKVDSDQFTDDIIDVVPNDVFLGLDLSLSSTPQRHEKLSLFSRRGVKIHFVVYDILLLQHPEWWPQGAQKLLEDWIELVTSVADSLVCISKSVAISVEDWLSQNPPKRYTPLTVTHFHLGADIDSSLPSTGMPQNASKTLRSIQDSLSFLMVGTVEPRKGYSQTLRAFEKLWSENIGAKLIIVGRSGWMVEDLSKALKDHPQNGKCLFWLENISDEYLEALYEASKALIFASEGEGFGLPLIEAAQHEISIIARDLPVFREVAGDHAFYFQGKQPEQLADALKTWMNLYSKGNAPSSVEMPWLTWAESTQQVLGAILPGKFPTIDKLSKPLG